MKSIFSREGLGLPGPGGTPSPAITGTALEARPDHRAVTSLADVPADHVDVTPDRHLIVVSEPRGPAADRMRYLRMHLRGFWNAGKLKSILITSPHPQDGKSTVSLNLACVLAESGRRKVLLIEGDLHRPALAEALGLGSRPGVSECIEGGLDPLAAIRLLEPLKFYLLQAGRPHHTPTELIQSADFPLMLERLRPHFDWILIDSPPVVALTDALALSRMTDGVLLVTRAGETPKDALEDAYEQLGPNRVVGVVLNAATSLNQLYAKYGRYYGDSHRPPG